VEEDAFARDPNDLSYIAEPLRPFAKPIDSLALDADNARRHSERNIAVIRESLRRFGQRLPLVVQRQGMIVRAGNGRLLAARELGWTHLAVVIVDESEVEAVQFALADNRSGELADWDYPALGALLQKLQTDVPEIDLAGLGWDDLETGPLLDMAAHADIWEETIIKALPKRVLVADLKRHPRNYKEHPDDQIEHVIQSIKQYGVYQNIIIARDNTILAGHGIVQAAKKMGITSVYVVRLNIEPDDPAAVKLLVSDNEIAHLARIDNRALSELLKEIKESDLDGLLGTGYDPMMLANLILVTRPEIEIPDINAAAEWVGFPEYDPSKNAFKLTVTFRNEKDRQRFTEIHHITTGRSLKEGAIMWQAWWPSKGRQDLKNVAFEENPEDDL
jgi:ParB-like chromosome segregation protein Spo0J